MDFGGYRHDPRSYRPMPSIPVTTITTGIPLSDRFKQIQHDQDRFGRDGYGLPPGASSRFGQNVFSGAARTVPKAVSQRNKMLALQLAKRSRMPQPQNLGPFRNRGIAGRVNPRPVQSRLGIARTNKQLARAPIQRGGMVRRGGVTRGRLGATGRGGLNRVQKSGGAINRNKNQGGKVVNNRGNANRGAGGARGGRGRGGNRGRGTANNKQNTNNKPVSRDDLDTELDSYMSNSRAYLDRQLDDYMLQAKAAAAAVSAGTVNVEDVNMAEA